MKAELIRLLRRQWVSPIDALRLLGCLSLSQRCGELRRGGVNVVSRWVRANGKKYKAYKIMKSAEKSC